jgi:predicted metal-dependent peptidase
MSLSVDDKFAKIMLQLRKIRPFYASLYEVIEKVEDNSIKTVGVTVDKLFYNKDFVDKRSVEEVTFIMLHEIYHIGLMHVARTNNRRLKLWNLACDLYVNKLLSEEFEITPEQPYHSYYKITFPSGGVFNRNIDTDKSCVEDIYDELLKNMHKKSNQSATGASGNDGSSLDSDSDDSESDSDDDMTNCETTICGKNIDLDDYKEDMKKPTGDTAEINNKAKDKVNEALVRYSMNNKEAGSTTESKLIDKIKEITSSKIDWRKLVRKYCIQSTEMEYSFNNPDKRLIYTGGIYPGTIKSNDSNKLGKVKICLDTSGSISDIDLGTFYNQVRQLLKYYKLEAEVIFWDTEVQSTNSMSNMKELVNIPIKGGGGTNPKCLFDYFISKECKDKPELILIFTDGYFYGDENNFKVSKNLKRTIWVMSRGYNRDFKPNFGKLAVAKFNDQT